MSSIAEYFTSQIEADLNWRELEMAILRKQLHQTLAGSPQELTFLRTNLAMIYAHYEGFCKFALGTYIDALEKLSLKRSNLRWSLASSSLGSFLAEMRKITDTGEYFTKLLSELESHLNEPARYERPDNIANLWPDLLVEWLTRLGLDTTNVQQEKLRLDTLVRNRNQIAHGKRLSVADRAELDRHAHAATLAMHEVAVGIANALEQKSYARHATVMTILSHAVV